MKRIIYSLIVLLALVSCEKEEVYLDGIIITPASHISKETTFNNRFGLNIKVLGYADIIKHTNQVHVNGNVIPFKKDGYSITIPSASIIDNSEIYLLSNADTIAYVPLELIQDKIFTFHNYFQL